MKLYEVNQAIDELIENSVDMETGEILVDTEELMGQLDGLQMEKKRVLEYLAKVVLNTRAETVAIKEEENRLKERRDRMTAKEERLMKILDKECDGEKTDLGIATLSYRKSSRIEVSDEKKAIDWLQENQFTDCINVPAPQLAKNEVKKLISAGAEIPGCSITGHRTCSLR